MTNFQYPTILDPDFLLDNDRFVWAKEHVSSGKEHSLFVAIVREKYQRGYYFWSDLQEGGTVHGAAS